MRGAAFASLARNRKIPSGAVAWSNGFSVKFDTTKYASFGQPSDIVGVNYSNTARTFSLWARINTALADVTFIGAAEATNRPLHIYTANGQPSVYLGSNNAASAVAMTNGTWYHICVSNSAAGVYILYVNAVQQDTNSAGTDVTALDFLMGARRNSGNTGTDWIGDCNVDEVTVWSSQFSGTDVTNLYNSGVPTDPTTHAQAANLLHYWPMGDGDTYPTLLDKKGSFNGTMNNQSSADIVTAHA